jgi:Flp pilus assembly protein TadD
VARICWIVLLSAGVIHGLGLSLLEHNLVNINVVHHYLGAKFPFAYASCYRVINAATGRPQIAMRDLERPDEMLRDAPAEQRAYYIDLMRAEGLEFNPLDSLDGLHARAEASGALEREARRILDDELAGGHIEGFRRDARRALEQLRWRRDIATDYGFNGSPFYALVRHLDPTLYRPFGKGTAILNLVLQTGAALLVAWLVGLAIGADLDGRLAAAALIFASWDFVGYALPGLVFAGLWIPVAIALLAMRRRQAMVGGIGVAWAGLIKLFPLVLVLPAAFRAAFGIAGRLGVARRETTVRWSLLFLAGCGAGTVVLALAARLTGRDWLDFLDKIGAQFGSTVYLGNGVGLSQWVVMLGERAADSTLPAILGALLLFALAAVFALEPEARFIEELPRRSLVLLGAVGLATRTWLNYYTIAPLLLLPWIARRHRVGAAMAAFALAAAQLLPAFDDPILAGRPILGALKITPYVLVPIWIVALEIRALALGRTARRVAVAAGIALALFVAGDVLRLRHIADLRRAGDAALDRGDPAMAQESYGKLARFSPRDAKARMNEAIAFAGLGRLAEAGASFAAAAALAPEDPIVRRNNARGLELLGRVDEAARELEAAHRLAPADPDILIDLARLRQGAGRPREAVDLLRRALELDPRNGRAWQLLRRLEGPRAPARPG